MVTKAMIDEFIFQSSLAIVGLSHQGNKFGNNAFKEPAEWDEHGVRQVHPDVYPTIDVFPQAAALGDGFPGSINEIDSRERRSRWQLRNSQQ